jgi:serine/threonine-protein kinase
MAHRKEGRQLKGTSYRILRKIGEGSTADVYEVIGRRGELRALKVLRPMYTGSREAEARLIQEGRALAALDHPHVVGIEDAGTTADGRPFLIMPRLRGETLRERLAAEGPLAAADAVDVVLQVLDGLAAAHRAGIVHRDVKPANVFLARRGGARPGVLGRDRRARPAAARSPEIAVLLDFGIAKLIGDTQGPTTGGHVLGTPRYIAPEQILGGKVDARTDVYAVGLLLFEAIAGRGPFPAGDAIEVMRAHLHVPPPRLRALRAVPPAIDRAVARAVAKAPALRWPSARAMADALAGERGARELPASAGDR